MPTASTSAPRSSISSGLKRGSLEGPAAGWFELLHSFDRERYRASLDTVLEQRCGRISHFFRLRAADGHYFWYALKARPVVGQDGEVVRIVGTLADCHRIKTAEERLLHDAVHDNLTGLPNRELFFDRLDAALTMGQVRGRGAADRHHARRRSVQGRQRAGRAIGRRFDPADAGAPARPPAAPAGHDGADRRRPVRLHHHVGAGRRRRPAPGRDAAAHARHARSPSATTRSP